MTTRFVAGLARPGGNITGSSFVFPEAAANGLGLLKEAMPRISRVAVLFNPDVGSAAFNAMEP